MNRYVVTYKDREGKRRTRVARVSIFADFDEAIRQVMEQERLPLSTYIYNVRQGRTTYIWRDTAYGAFNETQLKEYRY